MMDGFWTTAEGVRVTELRRMRRFRLVLHALLVPAVFAGVARTATAQQASADASGTDNGPCTYSACALAIAPRWNGLAVVRGSDGPQVANLHFFWPRDVRVALRGSSSLTAGADSAAAQARQAIRLRRIGAAPPTPSRMPSVARTCPARRAPIAPIVAMTTPPSVSAALGVSVPFQFAADGALSRAVWWHNRRFAR